MGVMKKLAYIILVLQIIGVSPIASWAGTIEDALERVRLFPNDANVHFNLGVAYTKDSQFQQAIASYKKVLKIIPNDTGALNNLGHAYLHLKRYKEAITILKEVVRLNPEHANAHYNLGGAYKELGLNNKAIAAYKEVLRVNPDDTAARNDLNKLEGILKTLNKPAEVKKVPVVKTPKPNRILEDLNKLERKMALAIPPRKKLVEELDQLARLEKPKITPRAVKSTKQKPITEKTFRELETLKNKKIKDNKTVFPVPLHEDILEDFEELKMKASLPEMELVKELEQLAKIDASPMLVPNVKTETPETQETINAQNVISEQRDGKRQSGPFCRSGKILPIDCTEADKNSREIWFGFTHEYKYYSPDELSSPCRDFLNPIGYLKHDHPGTGKLMRNGNVLVKHVLKKGVASYFEFLGLKAEPENSFMAASGIAGLKFEKILNIEFAQNINSVKIKYADSAKTVHTCEIWYTGALQKKLSERQTYELAHAEAVKSARKFGNVAPSLLQQRTRETLPPSISFSSVDPAKILRTDAYQTFIRGKVTDNEGVLTLLVNGQKAAMKADGTFAAKLKLRIGQNRITVLAEDINGNIAEKTLTIIREDFIPEETLADVDIPPKSNAKNPHGIAIVIGVESYQYVSEATYAYNDAEVFREYLADTMGFSKGKVKIVTNRQATLAEFNKLLAPNGWLARNVDPGKSEIVIYFSGHGIPNAKTKQTGLLPYDVDPNYSIGFHLSDLYKSLGGLNAKSVTVFLDACFTGENRERKMLLADVRGIVIVPSEKSIPNNLSVLSAASGGQFSGALKEKEHGLFTYYVLKGLGGAADSDKDKKLTMGELGEYVRGKVKERAAIEGREQTPELQGDPEQVLVQW
jgi:tetratricopeptide (TPR) repeat protein